MAEAVAELGPLTDLVGTWESKGNGWNAIALPYANGPHRYRLLVNRYDETLAINLVDPAVPNRGVAFEPSGIVSADQSVVTLGYEQSVVQIAAADFPSTDLTGGADLAIHFEPGLWLHMLDEQVDGVDIARLSSVPHGDAVLALGTSAREDDVDIPTVSGLPVGGPEDLDDPYLAPYAHFHRSPFEATAEFEGFDPVYPARLLRRANAGGSISDVTRLTVDTTVSSAGIRNIPFIVKQADASSMVSTFWTYRFDADDGHTEHRLQYLQVVMLDFYESDEGETIRWPHVSINTLSRPLSPAP